VARNPCQKSTADFVRIVGQYEQAPFKLRFQHPVLGDQVLIAQQQFLVHRSRDVGQDSCPVHSPFPIHRDSTLRRIVRNTTSHEQTPAQGPEPDRETIEYSTRLSFFNFTANQYFKQFFCPLYLHLGLKTTEAHSSDRETGQPILLTLGKG